MKPSEVSEIVLMLIAAYPAAKTSEATHKLYERMLLDLDHATTDQAVTRLIATSKWPPTIAEIREASMALKLGPCRTGGEAWSDALAEAARTSRYGKPRFADPLVAQAVRMWCSWRDFCASPEDDPGGRARFIELYDQLAARARADVVSGIALPAAKSAPRLTVAPSQTVTRKTEPQSPGTKQFLKPTVGSAPTLEVSSLGNALTRAMPKRAPSVFAGRTMTAAEIDAALEVSNG